MSDLVVGADGLARCWWGASSPEYIAYHDEEWGRPLHGDVPLFERITLEGFQSGLSWLTILRKREGFRSAFDAFDPDKMAAYGDSDFERLMADVRIVRNRAKIRAAMTNAQALVRLRKAEGDGALDRLLWSYGPADGERRVPHALADLPSQTPSSKAMAKDLKSRGFVFVGPTTLYALMQAAGIVDDHLAGCHARRP